MAKKITADKVVAKYTLQFYRSADLQGTFVLTKEDLKALKEIDGSNIYYGEVCGKHSDVSAKLSFADIEILTEDPEEVRVFEKLCPHGSGFNFKDYWFNEDDNYEEE